MRRRSLVISGLAVVSLVVTALVIVNASQPDTSQPDDTKPGIDGSNPFRTGRTLVIPHGGGDGIYPENTLLAFESTIAMGADVVDADLRISRDGVIVAIHDATVDRTTGASGKVKSMNFAELAQLDAGWAFAPAGSGDQHPYRGTGVTIPTLEAILDRFPTTLLSLDLKDESLDMVQPICDQLRSRGRLNDVFVGSNSDSQIIDFRQRCPEVRTSAIMNDVFASRDARAAGDTDFVPAVTVNQPPFRVDGREIVDAESLAWAHDHGVAILTWVVNDEDDMRKLIDLGVDGIYTSYPDRLLRLLDRCQQTC
jgi:glycerophosphoryl diester phosphodiesterase